MSQNCIVASEHQVGCFAIIADSVLRSATNKKKPGRKLAEEVADESRSTQVTVAADMVFSSSKNLSGVRVSKNHPVPRYLRVRQSAIVDFVKALSEVSWEEIQSSAASPQPRLFSLQKLVDIAYYNMGRIRLEWSNIWQIVGVHFNQVSSQSRKAAHRSHHSRSAVITIRTSASLLWTRCDNLPCVSWKRKSWRISVSRKTF